MSAKTKLLIVMAVLIAGGLALAIGVAASTISFVGLSLLCPAAMFFGMHAAGACEHNQQSGHAGKAGSQKSSDTFDTKRPA